MASNMVHTLCALAVAFSMSTAQASEAEITAKWCGERGLAYDAESVRLQSPSGRTVYADCVGEFVTVEVDFARKYYEGISQAAFYAEVSDKFPVLLLIVERDYDCRYVRDAWWLIQRMGLRMILTTTGRPCPR